LTDRGARGQATKLARKIREGRFVVVGSSRGPPIRVITFQRNGDLALNALNWLSSDEDLISIRPKEHGKPQRHHDSRAIQLGADSAAIPVAGGAIACRRFRLVAEKIGRKS